MQNKKCIVKWMREHDIKLSPTFTDLIRKYSECFKKTMGLH